MRRRAGVTMLSGLYALLGVADVLQLAQAVMGMHPDPPSLLVTHAVTGLLAFLASVGIWRARRWAAVPVLGWGVVTSCMLVALGPVLEMPEPERPELWEGAGVVAVVTVGIAWYLRRQNDLDGA